MTDGSPRILLVRLSAIGDCLHAIPVLAALRQRYPQAFLGWAIEKASLALLEGHPMVDRFHLYPRHVFKKKEGSLLSRLRKLNQFREEIAQAGYDAVVDLQGLTKSGLVTWWTGAERRIGFSGVDSREANRFFMNERIKAPRHAVHVVDRNLALTQAFDIDAPVEARWAMPLYARESADMEKYLAAQGLMRDGATVPFAIVNPGATWVTKRWPPERFGQVAGGLVNNHNLPVVVTWAGDEERAAAEVIVEVAGGPDTGVFLAPPTSLRELAALTARAALFVGNDTGPLHLAVALGVKCVAVFGASDARRNGPYGEGHRVLAIGPECQPCWKTRCARPGADLACLTGVSSEMVLRACHEVLALERRAAAV